MCNEKRQSSNRIKKSYTVLFVLSSTSIVLVFTLRALINLNYNYSFTLLLYYYFKYYFDTNLKEI